MLRLNILSVFPREVGIYGTSPLDFVESCPSLLSTDSINVSLCFAFVIFSPTHLVGFTFHWNSIIYSGINVPLDSLESSLSSPMGAIVKDVGLAGAENVHDAERDTFYCKIKTVIKFGGGAFSVRQMLQSHLD